MVTWKKTAMVGMGSLIVVELVFLGYDLPSRLNTVVDDYLGFQQASVWQATVKDFERKQWLEAYLRVREVDCRKVLDGDEEELKKASATERRSVPLPTDLLVWRWATNCSSFVRNHGFVMDPLSTLEKEFPIAYSIVAYKQASQVVDLLRAIYRPQNWYCLHLDLKSAPYFRLAMETVSSCFPNVFSASRAVKVQWGNFTVLEAELVCMRELWRRRWRYFINLTGQEFPLRTNYELVRILSAYNGANDIKGVVPSNETIWLRWREFLPAPFNITVYKGAVHIVASRDFVDYVLHSPKAQVFMQWCRQTSIPDEHFFNSLNHNPQLRVPGGSKGEVILTEGRKRVISPSLARFKNWIPMYPCPGHRYVRDICILNVLDLPRLHTRKELFANKFYADYSRLALQCLAEDIDNRTREQALGRWKFNTTFYEQQPFVKNRLW